MVYVDDSGYEASDPHRIPDQSFERTVTDTGLRRIAFSDPRPAKRIKAPAHEWLRLRKAKLAACRTCGAVENPSLHHLVGRDLGGDDIEDNLVSLCGSGTTGCHGLVEHRDPWACSLLGQKLTPEERAYVVEKKGVDFLARYYGVREAA